MRVINRFGQPQGEQRFLATDDIARLEASALDECLAPNIDAPPHLAPHVSGIRRLSRDVWPAATETDAFAWA